MISKQRAFSADEYNRLPHRMQRMSGLSRDTVLADPLAVPKVATTYKTELCLAPFRYDYDVSDRNMYALEGHLPVSQMFHEGFVFIEWLKLHNVYEYCGNFVGSYRYDNRMSTRFTLTVVAYITKDMDTVVQEYKHGSVSEIADARAAADATDLAEETFAEYTARYKKYKVKIPVTFDEALDLAKDIGDTP